MGELSGYYFQLKTSKSCLFPVNREGAESARKFFLKNGSPSTRAKVLQKLKEQSEAPVTNSTDTGEDIITSIEATEDKVNCPVIDI